MCCGTSQFIVVMGISKLRCIGQVAQMLNMCIWNCGGGNIWESCHKEGYD
jgi:hypothetical protein